MLTALLTKECLAPNGYVCIAGHNEAFAKSHMEQTLTYIAKSAQMQVGLTIAESKLNVQDHFILPANGSCNVLTLDDLDTIENKKPAAKKDPKKLVSMEGVALLLKKYAFGDSRPDNGLFVGFEMSKKGRVLLP